MSKHTPGPWTIFTDLPEQIDEGFIDYGGYRIDADGVEQLAYVWERSARVNPSTGEQDELLPFGSGDAQANARLISAAPDMYEALEACKSAMRAIGNNIAEFGSVTDQEYWDALWEAEAKALAILSKIKEQKA